MTIPSVLIVGCGYLGHRVALLEKQAGLIVHALTRSEERAEKFWHEKLSPIVGDVMKPETLGKLPTHVERLIYAVGLDRRSGYSQRDVYVQGLQNVLETEAVRTAKQMIYVSSTSVYGQHNGEWIDETSPCQPVRPNGQVCLEAENLARERLGDRLTVLRLSGLYGPGRLIGRKESLQEQKQMPGNPDGWLNLIHVDDAARVVFHCNARHNGETYLVSDDKPLRRREFYTMLARRWGTPLPQFAADHSPNLGKRCRNDKMKTQLLPELRWKSVDTGLDDAANTNPAC